MGDISHKFPRLGTKTHRIALIDGPNMSNLGRSPRLTSCTNTCAATAEASASR